MPNRVIRDSILDSERYWSVPIEARELYRHLQLLADDLGCVSLAPVLVRRRCFNSAPPQSTIDQLLQLLWDANLVLIYEVDGARYGYIPRFGQRLRRMYLRHPKPPQQFYENDAEALEKFNKIKGNHLNLSDTCLTSDGHLSAESKRIESNILPSNTHLTRPTKNPLKKFPTAESESNPETIQKNKRIASAMAEGNIAQAKIIRDS